MFVRELGAIDNAAYRSINRTDTLNASTHLRRLRDLDLLTMKGSGNRTYYIPGAAFEAISARPAAGGGPDDDLGPPRAALGGVGPAPAPHPHGNSERVFILWQSILEIKV